MTDFIHTNLDVDINRLVRDLPGVSLHFVKVIGEEFKGNGSVSNNPENFVIVNILMGVSQSLRLDPV
jgi:hypothetical protein